MKYDWVFSTVIQQLTLMSRKLKSALMKGRSPFSVRNSTSKSVTKEGRK